MSSGYSGTNPGYGFHSEYTQGQQYPGGRATNGTGGGFWTGMGTGGILGYLFGRQRLVKWWKKREIITKRLNPRKPNVLNVSSLLPFRAFGGSYCVFCFAEASPTITTTTVLLKTEHPLLETFPPPPQEHALLQVLHVN